MKRLINRLLCYLLYICLIIPLISMLSFAANETDNCIYFNNISTPSGCEIELPVYIDNNTGLSGFWLIFDYDTSAMTPVSVEKGDALASYDKAVFENSIGGTINDRLVVIWANGENFNEDGELIKIKFYIQPSANGEFPIHISYDQRNTYDEAFTDVVLNCQDGCIAVNNQQYLESTRIFVENVCGTSGSIVRVPVKIVNNASVNQTSLSLIYDNNAMVLTEITDVMAHVTINNSDEDNVLKISLEGIDAAVANGTLFEMLFIINEEAYGKHDIRLTGIDGILIEGGTVDISNPSANMTTSIYAEEIIVNPGETEVVVPVKIKYNHGIMGYMMDFHYDSNVLIPKEKGVDRGAEFSQGFFDYNIDVDNETVSALWAGSGVVKKDCDLLYITFDVLDIRPESTSITITYSQHDVYDGNYNDVEINVEGINLTFMPTNPILVKEGSTAVIDGKYIYGLKTKLTAGNLKNTFLDFNGVEVSFEKAIEEARYYGTGSTITLTLPDGTKDIYTIIIFGDVDGNSIIDNDDAFSTLSAAADNSLFDTVQKKAANVDGVRRISIDDYSIINDAVLGINDIDQASVL